MKRLKHNFKKGMAFVLSLAMVAGLVPAMSGGANTVQAATGSGTEPSVPAYATKTQLMDDGTFAPNSSGEATNEGKLVFGKNSNGNPQEWYILGKDTGVSGDNTIIFAASPIAANQVFNSSTSNKTFDSSFGVYASNPSEVYPNHYGASDLRVALKNMATNPSYFTTAEQGLMNATTVTTNDPKNDVTYTTTDKLYALAADGYGSSHTTIKAGSGDSTVLAMNIYWSNGSKFWLRSTYGYGDGGALIASPGVYVNAHTVSSANAVQPASNLNLSSVLFASAATAASSDTKSEKITDGTAMTLRLNGTGKNIGTVTYNTTTGDIKAVKGSTSQAVALVVQGNDGTNNWYYSKKITGTEVVNVTAIEAETNTPASINLSTCKIWLEMTDTDGLIYAVNADKEIESINTTYVTQEQLMNSFKPYSDGTAVNTGKLVFGKNSSGNPQEWYILGKDTGVSGDNTIIFAASPIATNQVFNSSRSNKTYNYEAGTGYGDSAGNIEVYSNHYGASDLRVALQRMLEDVNGNKVVSYFTEAEQGLMNLTTVTTKDNKNSATYTTTDKLYALAADGYGYKTIKAGTNNQTVLAMSKYWSSGDWFWLRSPDDDHASLALLAFPGYCVGSPGVNDGRPVQPASNLNLSSVLFASAATAASSDTKSEKITDGTAMTLRLNGTGKNIGTVTYNTTTGDIKAVKGSTSETVALVVQGNDGTNDWYYSKQITGTDTVNVTAIEAETNTPASIDLSTCKIWLEITDSTEKLTYAVNATETVDSDISSVAITGIDTPTANTTLDTSAACATTGVISTTPQITWTPSDATAGYNKSYTASITLTADTGYEFADTVTATVSGNNATSTTKNADGTLTVTYDFPATAKDKLVSITTPQAITVANGTAYSAMNLPATVNIVTEGNTVSSAQVTWNTTTPASGSYDPAVLTQQTVTLNGTVACPDSIDANGVSLTTTITITISAAGIVGAPTANPTAGTYSENQSVTLTSSTEGATIYYTTDGSEPTITGGVTGGTTQQYTAPILVTGTEGQSITTTIKAIAVKNGMQDSGVVTFTYTIQIPVTEYTITATAGANGSITPSGAVGVAAGGSQTFTISPSSGYVIDTLKVDGLEVTATTSYTFSDVNANHTIEVTFKQESQTPDVTAPSITTQPGNATVKVGETATFTLAASGTALTYQWQIDRNDGNGWVNIAGANEASYTTSTVNISCSGFKYQCVVSNSAGTVTSNTAVLTVTENIIPDPDPVDYEILDGANSNWEQNSDGSLSIRGSGALSKFVGVKVDGTLVDAKNYTVKEGSTIVTLKADYLNTLSVGSHTFEMIWTDGTASTTFTNKADTSDNGNNNQNDSDNNNSNTGDIVLPDDSDKKEEAPKTGDDTPSVWLFILTIISGTGLILTAKKRRKNLKMSEK